MWVPCLLPQSVCLGPGEAQQTETAGGEWTRSHFAKGALERGQLMYSTVWPCTRPANPGDGTAPSPFIWGAGESVWNLIRSPGSEHPLDAVRRGRPARSLSCRLAWGC